MKPDRWNSNLRKHFPLSKWWLIIPSTAFCLMVNGLKGPVSAAQLRLPDSMKPTQCSPREECIVVDGLELYLLAYQAAGLELDYGWIGEKFGYSGADGDEFDRRRSIDQVVKPEISKLLTKLKPFKKYRMTLRYFKFGPYDFEAKGFPLTSINVGWNTSRPGLPETITVPSVHCLWSQGINLFMICNEASGTTRRYLDGDRKRPLVLVKPANLDMTFVPVLEDVAEKAVKLIGTEKDGLKPMISAEVDFSIHDMAEEDDGDGKHLAVRLHFHTMTFFIENAWGGFPEKLMKVTTVKMPGLTETVRAQATPSASGHDNVGTEVRNNKDIEQAFVRGGEASWPREDRGAPAPDWVRHAAILGSNSGYLDKTKQRRILGIRNSNGDMRPLFSDTRIAVGWTIRKKFIPTVVKRYCINHSREECKGIRTELDGMIDELAKSATVIDIWISHNPLGKDINTVYSLGQLDYDDLKTALLEKSKHRPEFIRWIMDELDSVFDGLAI